MCCWTARIGEGYSGKISYGKKYFWHISTGNIIRGRNEDKKYPN